jgi:hypothetical protein
LNVLEVRRNVSFENLSISVNGQRYARTTRKRLPRTGGWLPPFSDPHREPVQPDDLCSLPGSLLLWVRRKFRPQQKTPQKTPVIVWSCNVESELNTMFFEILFEIVQILKSD